MKKLLFFISLLLMLAPTARAEMCVDTVYCEVPSKIYTPPKVSFFASEPSTEEQLYSRIEQGLLPCCDNGAMHTETEIDVLDFYVQASDKNAAINSNAKLTTAELLDIYASVVYNHPEIGNLISGFTYKYISDTTSTYNGLIKYVIPLYREIYSEEVYQSKETDKEKAEYLARTHNVDAYNQAIDYAFSKAVAPDMTDDLQKILSIHDYLADTVLYSPTIASGTTDEIDEYNNYNNNLVYTPYGALVGDRVAVCQGYSLAFKLLCNMAGIECGYASSDEINHIWNVVEYNGEYYHIDVTWDDPVTGSSAYNFVLQNNFMISEEQKAAIISNSYPNLQSFSIITDYECTDSTLNPSLPFSDRVDPLIWRDGKFWYKRTGYKSAEKNTIYLYQNPAYYSLSGDLESSTVIDADGYLPDKRLDSEIFNVFQTDGVNKVAVDSAANTSADLYVALYDQYGFLSDAKKLDISFNSYGEAVAEFSGDYSKLMLFSDNGIRALSYQK